MPVKKRGKEKNDEVVETKKIFAKDKNLVYLWCNENYAADFGISPKKMIGKTDYDLYNKKLADKYRKDDKKVMKNKITIDIEEFYKVGNKEMWVHTVKSPTLDKNGLVDGVLGIFWDVSKERKNLETIKENEEKFRLIFNGVKDAIYFHELPDKKNVRGKFLDINQSAIDRMGYSREEFLKNYLELIMLSKKILMGQV